MRFLILNTVKAQNKHCVFKIIRSLKTRFNLSSVFSNLWSRNKIPHSVVSSISEQWSVRVRILLSWSKTSDQCHLWSTRLWDSSSIIRDMGYWCIFTGEAWKAGVNKDGIIFLQMFTYRPTWLYGFILLSCSYHTRTFPVSCTSRKLDTEDIILLKKQDTR